jgi:hypothetical protein
VCDDARARRSDDGDGIARAVVELGPFANLDPEQLAALLQRMPVWEYARRILIRMGDPGDDLVVILSGTAQAFIRQGPGDRTVVGAFRPGDIVGEIGVLTGEARTADVVAETEVRALRLAAADFFAIANAHPEVRVLLTNIVAEHLGQSAFDGLGGKTIRGYHVRRCIGRGGMGIVYEATRPDNGEIVALKMMNHRLLYRRVRCGVSGTRRTHSGICTTNPSRGSMSTSPRTARSSWSWSTAKVRRSSKCSPSAVRLMNQWSGRSWDSSRRPSVTSMPAG